MGVADRQTGDHDISEDTSRNQEAEVTKQVLALVLAGCVVQLQPQVVWPCASAAVVNCNERV